MKIVSREENEKRLKKKMESWKKSPMTLQEQLAQTEMMRNRRPFRSGQVKSGQAKNKQDGD